MSFNRLLADAEPADAASSGGRHGKALVDEPTVSLTT